MIRLKLFGGPILERDGTVINIETRKAMALLTYLAVTGQSHSREFLACLFWPDYDETRARGNLRRTLWGLRKTLGNACLEASPQLIGLSEQTDVWVDVCRFQQQAALPQIHHHAPKDLCIDCIQGLTDAADLYQGTFMAGFTLRDAPDFDEWQTWQEENLRQTFASSLTQLIATYSQRGEWVQAVRWAQRWLTLDTLHEPAHQQLMRLYAQTGQKAAAMHQFEQCQHLLSVELGVAPSAETVALHTAIQAAEYEGRTIQTSISTTQMTLPLSDIPQPGPLPPGSHMPLTANPLFVGREEALQLLARTLQEGMTAAVGPTVASIGLGGIGKTQLAVEFAHRYGRFFPGGVFWLHCAEADAIPAQIAACGSSDRLNLRPDFDNLPQTQQVRLVQQAWQEPIPRLLIFDGCEDATLLTQWRPPHGGCAMLVTSRRGHWDLALGVTPLALETLRRVESVALLRRFQPHITDEAAEAIAAELGDLPLALHLAGSFLRHYQDIISPAEYLHELRTLPETQLLQHPSLQGQGTGFSPTHHDLRLTRTFAMSYERLDPAVEIDAAAQALLTRAACFAPAEPIPRHLLLASWKSGTVSTLLMADALARLLALGLVQEHTAQAIRLHQLTAEFIHSIAPNPQAQTDVETILIAQTAKANSSKNPIPVQDWQVHLRYLTSTSRHREDAQTAALMHQLGTYLLWAGAYQEAKNYLQAALAHREKIFGLVHMETSATLNKLGQLHRCVGDLVTSREHLEQALAIQEQLPDRSDSIQTADVLTSLGITVAIMGDLEQAQSYQEQALSICERSLGLDHLQTAYTLNNLSITLSLRGQYAKAYSYLQRFVVICEQMLGSAHTLTIPGVQNVGWLLRLMERLPEADTWLAQALALAKRVLGPGHPTTAAVYNNLGNLLLAMGDLENAQIHLERALEVRQQLLGTEHPDTAETLHNFGLLHQALGNLTAANEYLEQALHIQQQTLGADHQDTAETLSALGMLRHTEGKQDEARTYLEQALSIRERKLGDEHPGTADTMCRLARFHQACGNETSACSYWQQALPIYENVLGADNPKTMAVRHNLQHSKRMAR